MPVKASDSVKDIGNSVKAILLGPTGTGKSIAAASWGTKKKPVYVFDLDGRYRALIGYYFGTKQLDFIEYDNYSDVNYKAIEKRVDEIAHYPDQYNALIFDSVTIMAAMILQKSMQSRGIRGRRKTRIIADVNLPEMEDWQTLDSAVREIVYACSRLHAMGINIFLTAHELITTYEDYEGKIRTSKPEIMTGGKKASTFLPVKFDDIWRFENIESGGELKYLIKTKGPGTKKVLPTMPDVINITNAGLDGNPSFHNLYKGYVKEWKKQAKRRNGKS